MVIKIVHHSEAHKGHGVGLLRDGGSDYAFLYPLQRVRIGVHRHDDFIFDVVVAEHGGDFLPGKRLEADEGVHLVLLLTKDLGSRVESDPRVALDIHDTNNFYLHLVLQRVAIATQPLGKIDLLGHAENHDVTLAMQFGGKTFAAGDSSLVIIGADKEQPFARG